ncbi:EscI/YscI/HrpB family type III secretion system inner rod protein [Pokkaliibacter plantistimulans]|uniref:EscI/YscI/HrpB family type III secretion system inner rod protein n=1 Tax=Proteobacteria bacterium 228 TaxID=2083153 RepID=A0A2S5KRZ0_9PROT|nr:type III secretion system inner rod subunit SctI [Pokkaliibacter plantistimulans]PPC77026.1 EscI/YscI/HrpB family type III secretion system inner rod protein [Pokkaliibacter plantistimulans]
MSVKDIQGLGQVNIPSTAESGEQSKVKAPSQQDVHFFSAAMQAPQQDQSNTNVAERIVDQLSGSSEHLQELSDKANKALRKASKSSNPEDVIAANRSLSSFYLESLLTTKLISKGSQAIEKLTSLQ